LLALWLIYPATIWSSFFEITCMMDLSRFTDLLERAFLEFRIRQTRQRLSVSLNSFANYLDFSPPIVNLWLNGSKLPTQGNVERLIPKLVDLLDLEVYDILALARPDPDLLRLSQAWSRIPKEFRQLLAEQAVKYASDNGSGLSASPPSSPEKSASEPAVEEEKTTPEANAEPQESPAELVSKEGAALPEAVSKAESTLPAVDGILEIPPVEVSAGDEKTSTEPVLKVEQIPLPDGSPVPEGELGDPKPEPGKTPAGNS
jgi:transcriptional regulator with XRE-family HTH domain